MGNLPTGTVTFLFTDIEGSTRLLQRLGEDYEPIQEAHLRILREAIARERGTEIRTEGDAFFAVFPTAAAAVRAAVSVQRALAAYPWPHGERLRVRMGMHTGEGRLGGDDYLGIDVNRAARIAAAGHGGQVLFSEATRALVEHDLPAGVAIRDLGAHRLKDLAHTEHLHDLAIDGLPADFPALRTLDARPNNLPVVPTSFVGREEEMTEVRELLPSTRVVTLTGPGGTGKTRLALEVAARALDDFPDGAFFVDLAPLRDPSHVATEVAVALGVRPEADRSAVESVVAHLRDRHLLVVLDNFEQVTEGADVVEAVVAEAAEVRALVTSRVPLHLYGEHEYRVEPLSPPDLAVAPEQVAQSEAVSLFVDRARAVDRRFVLDADNARAVAEICARVDGLPLAIELAASRVRVLPPRSLLERLERRLPVLVGGPRNVPDRQRALRDTIAWSDDLLDEPHRRLLARLSVFVGGCTLEAAEAVCNPGGELGVDIIEGLETLVGGSLVRRTDEPVDESRFGMLETIREYAGERLAAQGDEGEVSRRHTEYYLDLAVRSEARLTGEAAAQWLGRFEREHDNVRAVLRRSIDAGDAETGLRLGAAVWRFWHQRGYLVEGRAWLREILSLPGAAPPSDVRRRALTALGGLAYWQRDFPEARRAYEEALGIARALGDASAELEARYNLAFLPWLEGEPETSKREMREALAMARDLEDGRMIMALTNAIGYIHHMLRDPAPALELSAEAVALARELGDRFHEAEALETVGMVHGLEGRHEDGIGVLLRVLGMKREDGNLPGVANTMFMLASLESGRGRHDRGVKLWAAADVLREKAGGSPVEVLGLDDPTDAARAAIGDHAVDKALREGRTMTLEEALGLAFEESEVET